MFHVKPTLSTLTDVRNPQQVSHLSLVHREASGMCKSPSMKEMPRPFCSIVQASFLVCIVLWVAIVKRKMEIKLLFLKQLDVVMNRYCVIAGE